MDATHGTPSREMPKYLCHKTVWALKIGRLAKSNEGENTEWDGKWIITPDNKEFGSFEVEYDYVKKHNPQVGGYYVVYKGGYQSFSPAEDFESGYDLIK